jgi:Apea-like HEPN
MNVPVSDAKARAAGVSDRAHIHEAVTNIVTGLEALLNTGEDEPIAAQFVKRSQALATELDIQTSRSYWNWVYDVRSKAVHGAEAHLVVPAGWDETEGDPPRDVARIARAQDVLRLVLRKAIEDEAFRAVFENEESIRRRFPLEEPA